MCKKCILLITLLFFAGTVWAQADISPAPWVGCENSGWSMWWTGGNEDPGDDPTDYGYFPELEEEPVFGFRYYNDGWLWQGAYGGRTGVMLLDGPAEESIVMPLAPRPENPDDKPVMTEYVQYVFEAETGSTEMGLEIWYSPDGYDKSEETIGDYYGGLEFPDPVEEVELEGDWLMHVYIEEFHPDEYEGIWEATHCHIIQGMDSDTNIYFDEAIVDFIWHDEEGYPDTPCLPERGQATQVSIIAPENMETGIKHSDDIQLVFQATGSAYCMQDANTMAFLDTWSCGGATENDPNVDPNNYLQGPFEYTIYWGGPEAIDGAGDPNVELMQVLDPNYTPTECNAVMSFDPCAGNHAPGTTYYWAADINDANVSDFRCGGVSVMYESPIFRYTTWGLAQNPVPANEEVDIRPSTVLGWENDGYAVAGGGTASTGAYEVFFGTDPEAVDADTSPDQTADSNTFDAATIVGPLNFGATYFWRVDECNDDGCPHGNVWSYSTAQCDTLEDFESYADATALKAAWQGYPDWNPGADNCVQTLQATIIANGPEYVYEPGPGSNKSMIMNAERYYLGGSNDEIQRTFPEANGRNYKFSGGRSLWIAYRTETTDLVLPADDIYMQLEDKDAGVSPKIYYTGDSNTLEWDIFYVSLIEAYDSGSGADPNTIKKIRIGIEGAQGAEAVFSKGYFDLLTRCAPICRTEEASLHPTYDWTGPEGPDCVVDGWDLAIVTGNWMTEDYNIYPTEPCEANLMVEYLFDSANLTDTSGNNNNGSAVGTIGFNSGALAIANSDDPCEVNGVSVPNVPPLFRGLDQPSTVVFDVNFTVPSIALGVARTPPATGEEGNVPGRTYGMGDTHALAIFARGEDPYEIVGDRFWIAEASAEIELGVPFNIALVYDGEENVTTMYVDGINAGTIENEEGGDPNVPDPCDDTVLIGGTLNWTFPGMDLEMGNLTGEVDNFQIYDSALTQGEVFYLITGTEIPVPMPVDERANLVEDNPGVFGAEIINFPDYTTFASDWMDEKLWPYPYDF